MSEQAVDDDKRHAAQTTNSPEQRCTRAESDFEGLKLITYLVSNNILITVFDNHFLNLRGI